MIVFHSSKKGDLMSLSSLVKELLSDPMWGGATETVNDDYLTSPEKETSEMWTGTTTFMTSTSSGSSSDIPLPKTTIVDRDDFVSSKPYDGDKPPTSIYADSTIFERKADGVWCR
ncbi:MAG: hypothetical protein ACKPKO_30345, partial [Candidatus Fonsibacter sp.]